jgi:hypothetical protein
MRNSVDSLIRLFVCEYVPVGFANYGNLHGAGLSARKLHDPKPALPTSISVSVPDSDPRMAEDLRGVAALVPNLALC